MNRRSGFTRIELLVVVAIVMISLTCLGLSAPLTVIVWLVIGWAIHLFRLVKEMVIDGDATLTAVVAIVLLVVGTHGFARLWRRRTPAVEAPQPWTWRWTASIIGLILCVAVAGIAAVGIAHQSVWLTLVPRWFEAGSLRHAVARTQSQNNLKQIALAAFDYHQQKKHLPAGATFDAAARPMHSWATLLLPYIEQDRVFEMVRLDVPWTHADNHKAFENEIGQYINPSVSEPKHGPLAPCHYAANVHVMGAKSMRLQDITDGTENTLLFGEAASHFKAWGQPLNWRDPALGINHSPHGFGNPMMPGASFAFADGSVRFLKESISPEVLGALATPAGGEKIDRREWE